MPSSPPLLLRTFGVPELLRGNEVLLTRRRKELGLLVFVAMRSPRGVPRSLLAEMLWPGVDEDRSRRSLRQALTELRSVVGESLITELDQVRLAPEAVEIDRTRFDALIAASRYREAIDMVAGPFLNGLDDIGDGRWRSFLESEREQVRRALDRALVALGDAALEDGAVEDAIRLTERLLAERPDSIPAIERLLDLLVRSGRRDEAITRANGFATYFRDELEQDSPRAVRELLAARSSAASQAPGMRALLTADFIGRGAGFALFDQLIGGTRTAGATLVVAGAAGSGRTRFLAELARRAAPHVIVDLTRGDHDGVRGSAISMLAALPGAAGTSPETLAALSEVAPGLRSIFPALPPAPGPPGAAHIAELLAAVAEDQVVVLMGDDVDPRDAGVLPWLEAARVPSRGVVNVFATDDTGRVDGLLPVAGAPGTHRYALPPLTNNEVGALIRSMAPFDPEALARLATLVTAETGGRAGAVAEVVADLAERGVLRPGADGRWVLQLELHDVLPVPAAESARVRRRLDRLSADARRLVEAAAVLAPDGSPGAIERVSGIPAAAFETALGEVGSWRLLLPLPGGGLGFRADATRRAIYESIAPSRLRALHAACAEAYGSKHLRRGALARTRLAHHRQLSGRPRRWWGLAGAATGVLVVLGVIRWMTPGPAARPGSAVFVADVDDRTDGARYLRTLTLAATTALQQSERYWIFPRSRVGEALARMGRVGAADSAITGTLALEIARREAVPIVVQLTVDPAPRGYLLTSSVMASVDSSVLAVHEGRAAHDSLLLRALDEVLRRTRVSLGGALSAREARVDSLPLVTTRSLEALQAYSAGMWAYTRSQWNVAQDELGRAVRLDSAFALAHLALANSAFDRSNDREQGWFHLRKAATLAPHLPDRERMAIEASEAFRRGDLTEAANALTQLAARYPHPVTFYQLANAQRARGELRAAAAAYRQSIRLSPGYVFAHINLATTLQLAGDFSAALAAYGDVSRLDSLALVRDNINHEWGQVFLRLDRPASAESAFRLMLTRDNAADRARGYRSLAYLDMYRGRYADASRAMQEAVSLSRRAGTQVSLYRNLIIEANVHLSRGDGTAARLRLEEARALSQSMALEPVFLEHLAATYARAGDLERALGVHQRILSRVGAAGPDSAALRLLAARLGAAAGRARDVLEQLKGPPAPQVATAAWHTLRMEAFDALGMRDSALHAASVADTTWSWGREGQEEWVRVPQRLATLALQRGDTVLARSALSRFVERWAHGDSTLPELQRARDQLRRLGPDRPRPVIVDQAPKRQ